MSDIEAPTPAAASDTPNPAGDRATTRLPPVVTAASAIRAALAQAYVLGHLDPPIHHTVSGSAAETYVTLHARRTQRNGRTDHAEVNVSRDATASGFEALCRLSWVGLRGRLVDRGRDHREPPVDQDPGDHR